MQIVTLLPETTTTIYQLDFFIDGLVGYAFCDFSHKWENIRDLADLLALFEPNLALCTYDVSFILLLEWFFAQLRTNFFDFTLFGTVLRCKFI